VKNLNENNAKLNRKVVLLDPDSEQAREIMNTADKNP
jgi:hypothetical protein